VERAQRDEMSYDTPVTEIGTTHNVYVAYPDDPIYLPLRRMNVYGIGRLPVIERGTEKYLGMIRRQDILKAYDIGLMRKSIEVDRTQRFKLRNIDKASFIEVEVGPNAPMVGVTLREFPCSDKCLILSIRRHGENIIAHGDTRIEAGDLIVAYTEQGADDIVLTQFT
jgi:CIC family chloride channel protein